MYPAKRIILTMGAIAAVAVCGACSGSSQSNGGGNGTSLVVKSSPSITAIPTLQSSDTITLPIDAYLPTSQEAAAITNASNISIAQCAKQFGVDFPFTMTSAITTLTDHSNLAGITSLTEAQEYGYVGPPGSQSGAGGSAQAAGSSLSPAQSSVITGWPNGQVGFTSPPVGLTYDGKTIPTGGCRASADSALGIPSGFNFLQPNLARSVSDSTYNQSQADLRVVAVFAKWSSCMAAKGFTYATPWTANDKSWANPASSDEIATAVADVECKQQVNVVGVTVAVLDAYQNTAIQQNIAGLTSDKKEIDAIAAKAATVVASYQ